MTTSAPALCPACGHAAEAHDYNLGCDCGCLVDPEQITPASTPASAAASRYRLYDEMVERNNALAARVAALEAALANEWQRVDALKAAAEMLDEAIEYVPSGRQRVETINARNMVLAALKAVSS